MNRYPFLIAMITVFTVSNAYSATEWAKVNGKSITQSEVEQALGGMNEGMRKNFLSDPENKKRILQDLIAQELIVQEGERDKLDQTKDYQEALKNFRRQFLAAKVMEKRLGTKIANQSEQKNYYQKNRYKYSTEQVNAQQILVYKEEEAKQLLTRAKAKGVDFGDLAEKYSQDANAKNTRGITGLVGRTAFTPEFSNPVFSAKEGAVIGPIKTEYGYHIVKILEKRPGQILSFNEVQSRVVQDMQADLMQDYVDSLKKKAKISLNQSVVGK